MYHYGQQEKPSNATALSKGVFGKPTAQKMAPVGVAKVTLWSSLASFFRLLCAKQTEPVDPMVYTAGIKRSPTQKDRNQSTEGLYGDWLQYETCGEWDYSFDRL